jgi:MFS transporter, DHA1 family, staphyloferrin B biosynthesis exporter
MSPPATIRLLFAIQLIAMGAMEMSGPFWPLHLRRLAASESQFAFAAVAVYVAPMLGVMLTSSFWGRIGDRVGHKPMVLRALLALALTQAALAVANGIALILLLRFVQGACAGFIAPAQAYAVAMSPADRRPRLFAFLQTATNVGSLGGAVAGGLILDAASFFWINASAAALCAACALAAWRLLPATRPAPSGTAARPASGSAAGGAPTLSIAGLLALLGLLLLSRMLLQAPFPLYVTSRFDARHALVGLCHGLLALGFVVGAPLWARHFESRSATQVLPQVGAVAAGCALLMAACGMTREVSVFAALYFGWGVLLAATTPVLTALVSAAAGAATQGRALGLAQGTQQFASIAGIALGMAWVQTAGLPSIYGFVAAGYALSAAVALALFSALRSRGGRGRRVATPAEGRP